MLPDCLASGFTRDLLPIVGVVVGWSLGEGTRLLRLRREVAQSRKALDLEIQTIVNQLPQLMDVIRQAIDALSRRKILPTEHVHTPRAVYSSVLAGRLYQRLSPAERNLLHVAYEHLRVADYFLDRFHRDLLVDLREGVVDVPWDVYVDKLRDVAASLGTVERLLRSYLSGSPIDPFPQGWTG